MDVDERRPGWWQQLERWALLAPIATAALWVIGFFIVESGRPDEATGDQVLAYFEDDDVSVYLGAVLFMGAALFLIWFVSALRERLGPGATPGPSQIGSVLFGSGLALALASMALPVGRLSGAFATENEDVELDASAAQALFFATDGFFLVAMYAAALFVLATAIAILGGRLGLPNWLAWVSIVLAIWLLIAPIGWIALTIVFPLWLIVVGLLLYTGAGQRQLPQRTPDVEAAPRP